MVKSDTVEFTIMDVAAPLVQSSLKALRETEVNDETMMERMNPHNASNISTKRFTSKAGSTSSSSSSSSSDSSSSDSDSDSDNHNNSNEESDDTDMVEKNGQEEKTMEEVTQQQKLVHTQSAAKPYAINNTRQRKHNHRRVVSAMPSIQGLPRGFDINNLNGLDKNHSRAARQGRLARGKGRDGTITNNQNDNNRQNGIKHTHHKLLSL